MTIIDATNVLGLTNKHNLTKTSIKQAYHKAAKLAHPDLGGSNEHFQIVKEAYEMMLKDIEPYKPNIEITIKPKEPTMKEKINKACNNMVIKTKGLMIQIPSQTKNILYKSKNFLLKQKISTNGKQKVIRI